jgi:hypothetical protein
MDAPCSIRTMRELAQENPALTKREIEIEGLMNPRSYTALPCGCCDYCGCEGH